MTDDFYSLDLCELAHDGDQQRQIKLFEQGFGGTSISIVYEADGPRGAIVTARGAADRWPGREAFCIEVISVLARLVLDVAAESLHTVTSAAEILGCTPRTVRGYIERGLLPAQSRSGMHIIRERDLDAVRNVPRGRPKKKPEE